MELNGTINRSIPLSGSMIARGLDGRGIVSIAKTGTSGLVDTYTITYTDATTSTFTVTNGANGQITATSFAEEFSSSKAYAAGDYVVYSGQLYQFTTAHAAGAWNASHATAVQLAEDVGELKSDVNDVENWLGYPVNLFDARLFAVTNTTNWTIQEASKTSFTIKHNNEWGTGQPDAPLSLASGEYVFGGDFSESALKSFALVSNGSFVQSVGNGDTFTIDETKTNLFRFAPQTEGTFTVTDIYVIQKELTGKIPTIESDIEVVETNISDLQTGFADISETVKSVLTGTTQTSKAIRSTGEVYTAGSAHYCVTQYDVSVGKKYWITANTSWGNLLWCFYNSSDEVVELGTASASSSDDTIITDEEVTAPSGATYILISFNDTVGSAVLKTETGYKLKGKWVGKKWVCVGDSLTAENIRTTKHYFDYVAEETGITTVNMGVSGSGYARMADTNNAFYQRISSCPTDADVVTIFGSFNDSGAGLPLGSVNDTGTDTLAGCINTTITNLQTVIPLVNLGIVAPTPWDTTQPTTSGSDYNYVEMLKAICERRSIPFLDLWRCSNLRPWDADFRTIAYSKDGGSGTHPDENGHKLIAPRFKGFLETLLM